MDDLSNLQQRAQGLRARVHTFLADLDELAPAQYRLLADLAEIDDHLKALAGQDYESSLT